MKTPHLLTILSLILLPMSLFASPLPVGSPAPTLTLLDQDGNPFNLAEEYKKGVVLVYFYPKADTPGCTAQACSLRDSFSDLQALGIHIVGVSSDSPQSQKKFQQKHNLPFPLLSDSEGKLAQAFGVGRILGFPSRSSFLIKDGIVVWSQPNAKTSGHAEEVRQALQSLKAN